MASAIETVKIAAEEAGQRLDRVLAARIPALSRSRLKALILDGQVTIDGAHDPRSRYLTSIPATPSRVDSAGAGAGQARGRSDPAHTSSTRTTR